MGILGQFFSYAFGMGSTSNYYSKHSLSFSEHEIKHFFEHLHVSSLTTEERFAIRDAIIRAPERNDGRISLWTINQLIFRLERETKQISENDRRGVMQALKKYFDERSSVGASVSDSASDKKDSL